MLNIKPKFVIPGLEVAKGGLTAPMPGKVIDIKVKKGKKVKIGDTLVILEAMKMEHRLTAPRDGKISLMTDVEVGGQVKEGDFMFELEDE